MWKQSAHAKLLQRPPTENTNTKHAALLEQSYHEITKLSDAANGVQLHLLLQTREADKAAALIDEVFAARAVSTLAGLLVWLQQRPELLQLPEDTASQPVSAVEYSYCGLWSRCTKGT
jgi:hypothetical protein